MPDYKPGDTITMKVLAVEYVLMRVEFDGRQVEIETPVMPMSRARLHALQKNVLKRWREITQT